MQRVDGAYLYELGAQLRAVLRLEEQDSPLVQLYWVVDPARTSLKSFTYESVFSASLRTLHAPTHKLINEINSVVPTADLQVDWNRVIDGWRISVLKTQFRSFEAVLLAELQAADLYHVSPKGGFDTGCLTNAGEMLFPNDLPGKVPGAVSDVKAGARCIAFDLPTAAGFHLHRANEAVLRAYFDLVAGKDNRPKTRNMGDYLKKMESLGCGDAKVIDVLKSLKDLHRNPLMHPEDSLGSIDEALSLYAAVRAAIGYMLERMPTPSLSSPATIALAIPPLPAPPS